MKKLLPYLLILAALFTLRTDALADPGDRTHMGIGFYFGSACPTGTCAQPNGAPFPAVQSPPLYVSIPYDNGSGNFGYATLPAGWAEQANPDAYGASCSSPQNWMYQGYGTVTYNDGTISYTGAAKFSIEYADTAQVALPSGDICCWQCNTACSSFPPLMYQPKKFFVRKIKIQSCLANHTLTDRFIGYGCNAWTESQTNGEPYCYFWNATYVNLAVSGF